MPRPWHPSKEIESAVKYAESRGWIYVRSGSHAWGVLRCPARGREGHHLFVHSTPRDPSSHAKALRRTVDQCNHVRTEP